jgi:predicted Zn-dependent protease
LAITALVAASLLFGAGKDRVGAQRLVQTAESVALESERRGSMPPRALELGLDLLRRAEMLDPAEVSVEITRGGLFMVGGRSQAAERAYRRALEMENRAEVWINLARMRLAGGDREGALEAARNAHRLDTRVARKLPEFPELEDDP